MADDNNTVLNEIATSLTDSKSDKQNIKILNDIKESFSTQMGGLAESLKPSSLLGLFGSEFSSPIVGMLGSKLEVVEDFVSSNLKNAFMQESKEDAAANREVESNDILSQIAENTGKQADVAEEGSGFMDMLKNPGQILGTLVSGLTGGLVGVMSSKSGSIVGKLFRGLGKMSLPVALLFGARDFIKGFRDVEKIAGTTNIVDAVEAGISELLSSLTFGLISPKRIYGIIDFVEDKFKDILRAPFTLLHGIIEGNTDIDVLVKDFITNIVSGITLGFISKDKIKNTVKIITDNLINIFNMPFNFIQDILSHEDDIATIIKRNALDLINSFTFGIITRENIQKTMDFVIEKIKKLYLHPILMLQDIIDSYTEFLDVPTFDVTGLSDDIAAEVIKYIDDVISSLQNFTQDIKDKIWDRVDELKEFFSFNIFDDKSTKDLRFGQDTNDQRISRDPIDRHKDGVNDLPKKQVISTDSIDVPTEKANLLNIKRDQIQTDKTSSKLTDRLERLERLSLKKTQQPVQQSKTANIAQVTTHNTFADKRNTSTQLLNAQTSMF